MKKQTAFALLAVLALVLSSCGTTPPAAPTTPTLLPTQQTVIPTDITYPTFTPTPLVTAISYPTLTPLPTEIPYPTASVVNANAVAFIAENALWVANVDGSGERRLTDIAQKDDWGSFQMQWSPDGKWVSYISNEELWLISPDSATKKKVLPFSYGSTEKLFTYAWSPDGTKIAYILASNGKDFTGFTARLLDLIAKKDSEILIYQPTANMVLSWSPDGHYIFLDTNTSQKIFEVATGKVAKEINSACPIWHGVPVWSPNSKWFYRADYASGNYYIWVCMNGLDGKSWQAMDGVISSPVWDETGSFLYFMDRNGDIDNTLNSNVDEQLMRYDVRSQETKRLLSLTIKHTPYSFMHSISISPDRHTLLLRSQYAETKFDLIFINLQSLAITKYTVNFENLKVPFLYSYILETAWSPDNQNLILFAGDFCTPSGCGGWGPRGYGSFYTLNIKTGMVSVFSGQHSIYSWVVSPVATTP